LNTFSVFLGLPAAVISAVVFEDNFIFIQWSPLLQEPKAP
jgi:hypothetical protein